MSLIKKPSKCWLLYIFSLLLINSLLEGRFIERDANIVDKEYQLHEETFHNRLSYMDPLPWQKNWWLKDTGYWSNFGSLNLFFLNHMEEVKITTPEENPIILSFKRSQRGEISTQDSENELSISFNLFSKFYFGLQGDGTSDKRYYDAGAKIFYILNPKEKLELSYWSQDHFYNIKEYYPDDRRSKNSKTFDLKYQIIKKDGLSIKAQLELDTPLVWERVSKNHIYKYEAKKASLSLIQDLNKEKIVGLDFYIKQKKEKKIFALDGKENEWLGIEKKTLGIKSRLFSPLSAANKIEWGLSYYQHKTNYDLSENTAMISTLLFPHNLPEEKYQLIDLGLSSKVFFHTPNVQDLFYTLGTYANFVDFISHENKFKNLQAKVICGVQFAIADGSYASTHLTWDMDELYNYLVHKKTIRKFFGGASGSFIILL